MAANDAAGNSSAGNASGSTLGYATRLTVAESAKPRETLITVNFTHTPAYIARFSDEKRRFIVDVMDSDVRGLSDTYSREVGIVKSVLTQAFATGTTKTTRLLISLKEAGQASINVDGKRLLIHLQPDGGKEEPLSAAKAAAPAAAPGAPAAAPGAATAPPPANFTPPAEGKTATSAGKGAQPSEGVVRDVKFERKGSSDWIDVSVDNYSSYAEEPAGPGRVRLVLRGARLSDDLARTLDVRAFGGGVQTITSSFDAAQRSVSIEVERQDKLKSFISEHDGHLSWSFFAPGELPYSLTGIGSDGGVARKARTLHVDEQLSAGMPVIDAGDPPAPQSDAAAQAPAGQEQSEEAAGFGPTLLGQQAGNYAGRRIDLDLKDADVHNVLRLLADVGQVNIVTADNVSGSVTIRMRNVPWDQALDVVLQSKGLGMVRGGNIIRVAPLAQLEHEREMAIARRRQELQLAPIETRLIPVSYASAEEIQSRAKEVLSGRGSIAVDGRTNVLIARDVSGTLDQVEELVRSLDTQTPQVLVEARIVESTSRYLRELGIQWGGDATFSAATGNATGLAFPSSVGVTGGASDANTNTNGLSPFTAQVQNPNFAVNLPAAVGTGVGGGIGLTLGSVDNNFNLNLRLTAAETTGMVRILSSPRVLTLDNHEARISQGTLIPFSQVSAQGVQTTFQEAKLQLLVKPHVTADGSVSMHVKINRDEPDFNQTSARGDPTILKREAETELLVMDGHTAVIGGIYTRNAGVNVDQVPFFGDIPLIGLLFQHHRANDARGELVIFLTPRIVNRAQALGR
ncbi:MAG TPA: type IV pilus secretin PilQ [Polyangiaceae bacterium]|nr:type IV pilus secretin PilQ [Polyangiaceae bacterium]